MSASDHLFGGLLVAGAIVVARARASAPSLSELPEIENVDPPGTGTESTSAGDEVQAPDGTTVDVTG